MRIRINWRDVRTGVAIGIATLVVLTSLALALEAYNYYKYNSSDAQVERHIQISNHKFKKQSSRG